MKRSGNKKRGDGSNKLGKMKNHVSEDDEVKDSDSASDEVKDSDSASDGVKDSDSASDEVKDSDSASDEVKDSDSASDEVKDSDSASDEVEDSDSASDGVKDSDSESDKVSESYVNNLSENEEISLADKQIQVYFVSNMPNEKYKMEDTIYTVPISFKRIDLSRMIKQLLDIKENVSFEFLINKKILRSSIEEFLRINNILSEDVIQIEYTLSITKKESAHIDKISEWISKLIIIENKLYCSTFEGNLLCYDLSNFYKIDEKRVSDMSIFSFNICKNEKLINDDANYNESIIGQSNGTLKAFLNEEINQKIITKGELYLGNHDNMVKSIAFNKNGSLIISGGADNKINLYDNYEIIEKLKEYKCENNTNKRKMKNIVTPKKCVHKEEGVITDLTFFDDSRFLCTGLEKNIKIYDANTGDIFSSFPYNKAIICSNILNDNIFITADEQSVIKLFDVRCLKEKPAISLNEHKYYFHDKIITSLAGNKNEIHFLSSSHDGYTNIYDIRLNKLPVYTIESEDKSKVLSSTWFYKEDHNSVINANEQNLTIHNF
ncbi:microtubule-associated protein ytm1 homologue [Plasmodium gonderi]|uniref:Microtubule-associated protein ytm1 homologue n=1 Tax=Plasmodium gonderi TaxID=77519 RepID=A0A1Y1JGT2_PLAGO|nr:microtubule-associated protein ytm1 homologue [Plasmodium gonderi]GAW81726.1 microtubule-associated protein ytm1 homologue [Plasmodium gonderi]